MIVTHIDGRTEMLTDYKSLQRKRRVNGEYSLSFLLFKTDKNEHSFPLTIEESLIEYDGQQYRIKKMAEKTIGNTPVKQIQADHTFFDLVDEYQYDKTSGTKSLSVCLMHALQGTGYTFDVVDAFSNVEFENFGDDNALALIQTALNSFKAEISINKKHLTFKKQIGRKTDIQFRYKHNIKTIDKFVDSSNLSTYIRGFGKLDEDGVPTVEAAYLSPLSRFYGIRHAPPVRDERYTTYVGLYERIVNDLKDKPDISISLDIVELEKVGVNTEQIELGDEIFTIYEPLDVDIDARIVEIIEFPEEPTSNQVTLANFRSNITDQIADFGKTKDKVDGIFDGSAKLPFNVLDEAVKKATIALQSAQTELEFENGIIGRDPRDPNRLTLFTSAGIGISVDGGKTFKEAITAGGFVLSAGAIGQLAANNITVGPGTNFYEDYDPSKIKIEVQSEINDVSNAVNNLNTTINTTFKDGIITEAEAKAIATYINTVNTEKAGIDNKYGAIYSDSSLVGSAKTNLFSAKNAYNTAHTRLINSINNAIADGKTTVAEKKNVDAKFIDYSDWLAILSTRFEEAVRAIETAKVAVFGDVVQVWKYPNTTMINGGSIFTNTIDVNRLKAGLLVGFTISTQENQNLPRVLLQKDNLKVQKQYNSITIETSYGVGSIPAINMRDGSGKYSAIFHDPNSNLAVTNFGGDLSFSAFTGKVKMSGNTELVNAECLGNFNVKGTKNASVPTSQGMVNISAYETAEYYFGDIGRGNVVDGQCVIEIESLFKETVNTEIQYEVFLTPYGRGVIYVDPDEMTPDKFIVKGDDIPFAYEIKAKRKGYEDTRLEFTYESEVDEFV